MNPLPSPFAPVSYDFQSPAIKTEFTPSLSQFLNEIELPQADNETNLLCLPATDGNPLDISPSSQQPRRRRKREAIELPEELAVSDAREVKRIKNRIAAARLRERSQQKIRDLEAEVLALRRRNEYLESMVLKPLVPATPVATNITVDARPSSPVIHCQSPVSIDDGAAQILGEFENDLLHQLLWHSEELAT